MYQLEAPCHPEPVGCLHSNPSSVLDDDASPTLDVDDSLPLDADESAVLDAEDPAETGASSTCSGIRSSTFSSRFPSPLAAESFSGGRRQITAPTERESLKFLSSYCRSLLSPLKKFQAFL